MSEQTETRRSDGLGWRVLSRVTVGLYAGAALAAVVAVLVAQRDPVTVTDAAGNDQVLASELPILLAVLAGVLLIQAIGLHLLRRAVEREARAWRPRS